jgi:hypothetical protein
MNKLHDGFGFFVTKEGKNAGTECSPKMGGLKVWGLKRTILRLFTMPCLILS